MTLVFNPNPPGGPHGGGPGGQPPGYRPPNPGGYHPPPPPPPKNPGPPPNTLHPPQGVGPGVTGITNPNGPPGNQQRGTAMAVIQSVDNANTPMFCTILVNNKTPGESGYILPTGAGPFAAGGTAGYYYFYDNAQGIGGSWVEVDLDARIVLSFTGQVSTSPPTPFYKALADHKHSGTLNPDGYLNPVPVNLSGETSNNLPYNQNTPVVQNVIGPTGNILYTQFPGGQIQSDGSMTNLDGVSSVGTYQFAAPSGQTAQSFIASIDIRSGLQSGHSCGLVLGNTTNGYGMIWTPTTQELIKWVSGTPTLIANTITINQDSNYHSFRLTIVPDGGVSGANQIEGSIDGNYFSANDSSLTLTSGSWPVTLYTGGNAGSVQNYIVSATVVSLGSVPPNVVGGSTGGSTGGSGNLISDSNMDFCSYNNSSPATATSASYWTGNNLGTNAHFARYASSNTGQNNYQVSVGNSGVDSYIYSTSLNLAPGTYTVSAYIDATTCTGLNQPFVALVQPSNVSALIAVASGSAQAFQTVGQRGRVFATFSVSTLTPFVVILSSNAATIASSIIDFSVPMLQAGKYMTAYMAGTTAGASGQMQHTAQSTQVQSAISSNADSFGSYITPGVVNRLSMEVAGQPGGTNLVYNPTASAGYSGWTRFNNAGNKLSFTNDAYGGGRFFFSGTLPASDYDGYEQNVSTFQNLPVSISAIVDLGAGIPSGVTIKVDIVNNAQTTVLATLSWTTGTGRVPSATTFNSGANSAVWVRFYAINGTGSSQALGGQSVSKIQFEYGTQSSAFVDHLANYNHNQIFDANAYAKTSSFLNHQGSILTVMGAPGFTYTTTTTSITLTVDGQTLQFPDGSTGNPSTTAFGPFTGLTNGNTYYFNIYYNPVSNAYSVVGPSGAGTKFTNYQVMSDVYSDNQVSIYANFGITTSSGGSGNGSGGSGGGVSGPTCPADYQLMLTKERGWIRADEMDIGDHLPTKDGGWTRINDVLKLPCTLFEYTVESVDGNFETLAGNDRHSVQDIHGVWHELRDYPVGADLGGCRVTHVREIGKGFYIAIDCDGHEYMMGKNAHLAHNATTPS